MAMVVGNQGTRCMASLVDRDSRLAEEIIDPDQEVDTLKDHPDRRAGNWGTVKTSTLTPRRYWLWQRTCGARNLSRSVTRSGPHHRQDGASSHSA